MTEYECFPKHICKECDSLFSRSSTFCFTGCRGDAERQNEKHLDGLFKISMETLYCCLIFGSVIEIKYCFQYEDLCFHRISSIDCNHFLLVQNLFIYFFMFHVTVFFHFSFIHMMQFFHFYLQLFFSYFRDLFILHSLLEIKPLSGIKIKTSFITLNWLLVTSESGENCFIRSYAFGLKRWKQHIHRNRAFKFQSQKSELVPSLPNVSLNNALKNPRLKLKDLSRTYSERYFLRH